MILFGKNASKIGTFEVPTSKCLYCKQENTQRLVVFGKYAHLYWMPIFPTGKKAVLKCMNCEERIDEDEFSPAIRKIYIENELKTKRPPWHLLGFSVFWIPILLWVWALSGSSSDHRHELLQADIQAMISSPTMATDSISYKIKKVLGDFSSEEINLNEFEYLTKIENGKALILVRIPNLKKVEENVRIETLEIIEIIIEDEEDLKGVDPYIGICDQHNMMMIKTPTNLKSSDVASNDSLYDFYDLPPE